MKILPEIIHFFQKQGFVIVSTIDEDGSPHSSCKGIIEIDENDRVYLLDLYKGKTYENLKRNINISIAAVDEHRFVGYCLKGHAKIVKTGRLESQVMKMWKDKIASRVTHRIIKRIHGERGHPRHPEVLLPKPKYMIAMKVEEVIDLTPEHIKKGG